MATELQGLQRVWQEAESMPAQLSGQEGCCTPLPMAALCNTLCLPVQAEEGELRSLAESLTRKVGKIFTVHCLG